MGSKRLNQGIQKRSSMGSDKPFPVPFSTVLEMVRDRKYRLGKQLIDWRPSNNGCNASRHPVPSLLDHSLIALALNAEAMVSLELVPDCLRGKLAGLICFLKKMDYRIFKLFVRGSPTEIRIKDSSWLTRKQLLQTFRELDTTSLMVLQLDECLQYAPEYVICKTLARFSKSLPNLGVISLEGCLSTSNGLKSLVKMAPVIQSINLSRCSLITNDGINILARALGSKLKELCISFCPKIDAMLVLPELKRFEYLEVLSVAGIENVCDEFVYGLLSACGHKMKELDLSECLDLTNFSLKVIGDNCTGLLSLNISYLYNLTDSGLEYLADGCRHIQTLKLCHNEFRSLIDEAIAAFVEASGKSLKELSLRMVDSVGPCTAFSLAKCSKELLSLHLSYCPDITNGAVGLIVDGCSSLKLVELFGCTQITDVFLNGHSNSQVLILGLQLPSIQQIPSMLEPSDVLLRYSPLKLSFDSATETENTYSSSTKPVSGEEKGNQGEMEAEIEFSKKRKRRQVNC